MSDTTKHFISAQSLLDDSFELALTILKSDFRPKFIVGVWRGGCPTGIAVQELLDHYGIETDHIAIRTSSYVGMERKKEVRVHGLEYIIDTIDADDGLLIIDDVFDTGNSVKAIIEKINEKCRRNTPHELKVATVYYKPAKNMTDIVPDFYVHETDEWLVFPHELKGCTEEEIVKFKGLNLPKLEA